VVCGCGDPHMWCGRRCINPSQTVLGQEPRQTTSNVGHLNKPSIQVPRPSSLPLDPGHGAVSPAVEGWREEGVTGLCVLVGEGVCPRPHPPPIGTRGGGTVRPTAPPIPLVPPSPAGADPRAEPALLLNGDRVPQERAGAADAPQRPQVRVGRRPQGPRLARGPPVASTPLSMGDRTQGSGIDGGCAVLCCAVYGTLVLIESIILNLFQLSTEGGGAQSPFPPSSKDILVRLCMLLFLV